VFNVRLFVRVITEEHRGEESKEEVDCKEEKLDGIVENCKKKKELLCAVMCCVIRISSCSSLDAFTNQFDEGGREMNP